METREAKRNQGDPQVKMPDKYWEGYPLFDAGLPWLTPGAIEELGRILRPQFRVIEFGAGGSTVFFARRCAHVTTWENDLQWVRAVHKKLNGAPNASFVFDLDIALSPERQLDLVMVDSNGKTTNRQKIANLAVGLVAPGGYFVLDNYGRYSTPYLAGWKVQRFDDPHWSGNGTLIAERPYEI